VALIAGRRAIALDPGIAELASARCDLPAFQVPGGPQGEPAVRLSAAGPPGSMPREAVRLGRGGYLSPDGGADLQVWLPGDAYSAEAALRAAYAYAFERQGGLLLHAAGICFPDPGAGAWLAVGPSEAGKSTLSQLCADAGAEVLSDETVGWLPDGTLWATPFRSSARFDRRGPPSARALSVLAFLEHGEAEALERMEGAAAVRRLLPQTYRTRGPPALKAVAALVEQRGAHRFRFRNRPEAAAFVRAARG